MNREIVIINAKLFAPDTPEGFVADGFVEIGAGRITALGSMAHYVPPPSVEIIDAGGSLVMPGLVNGHNHAAMTLFRGMADDLPLMSWLEQHIFPAEARFVTPEMVYWCTRLAAAEMIMSGTTTVADAYFYEDEAARAFVETGMRAVAAHGIIDFPAPGVPDPAENVATVARFIERWQGTDLLTPAVFAHSPYTCSSRTLVRAKELARAHNVPFFIHLAETGAESGLLAGKWQGSPTAYLHSLDLLDEQTVCVHAVWLDKPDIELIAASGAAVVTCPQSNMKLAAGIAPVAELLAAGVRVGLGTDGCASNNDLDLFGEMDTCAKLHKVRALDPAAVKARDVLRMATGHGARLLGFADGVGLAVGLPADVILIDLDQPHLTPFYSVDNLVYAAGGADVRSVIINGRLVMSDRKILTFDVAEAMEMVAGMTAKVRKS
ncbi:MAG: amidohydrolase [Proteobacteria bacterium]|nr:amidohydrolase [Pseudomonadota bacterium]MBU4294253.1 amidohydrolase [Pseudomonadota bacterium]MCG2748766.1 amidohydrolase [Desulfobulbaceae bacterium]